MWRRDSRNRAQHLCRVLQSWLVAGWIEFNERTISKKRSRYRGASSRCSPSNDCGTSSDIKIAAITMNWNEFTKFSQMAATWGADYHTTLRELPVRAQVAPDEIIAKLPGSAPETAETIDVIWQDFQDIVMPGITHWQHPRFFAYFNANNSPASVAAEFLVSIIAPNCMLWQASPAATEIETRMMQWLAKAVGLPDTYKGVIQDSASSATLAAVLTMREKSLDWKGNAKGLSHQKTLRIYCSNQVHSSIDRAIWIAGIGQENLVKIPTQGNLKAMCLNTLRNAIITDRSQGYLPIGIIGATGATGMGACDDLNAVADIAEQESLFTHLDAAWAGAAMICPEYRFLWEGADRFDSIVLNPHKWLGAQFDCSTHFLKEPDNLRRTLAIYPEYLKTNVDAKVTDYSEWSIPLGRRFRALKLWFLMRCYGLEGLRSRIRNHVNWSQSVCERLSTHTKIEITSHPILTLWTFKIKGATDEDTRKLVDDINNDGRIYLTPTTVDDALVIRFQGGTFDCTEKDFQTAYETLVEFVDKI